MGLDNTSAYFKAGNKNIARVYEKDGISPLPVEYVYVLGSGGISSTAIDLCKYVEIFQSETVLNQAMVREYAKAQYGPETVPVGAPLFNVGLGWDYAPVHKFEDRGVNVFAKNGGTVQFRSQLYVLPEEHINIAVIFAGAGNPTAVTDAILEALLEEKGIAEKSSTNIIPPEDAKIPYNLREYEGFYSSDNGLMKAEILMDENKMTFSYYNGNEFKPANILTYKGNGRFYRQDGVSFAFAKHDDKKVIIVYPDSSDVGFVSFEKLNDLKQVDTSAFSGKVWVPRNFGQYDFLAKMIQVLAIPEIPEYVVVYDGATYTPLALTAHQIHGYLLII
jgi:hypothetical protein